jgi:hypothetical protein
LFRFIPRLTFANVVSLLALFVALGGAAYAAVSLPKNSVGTKQLQKGAVTNSKLARGAVTGSKVAAVSLTGKQIKSSTLGRVPLATTATNASHASNADQLGGQAPSAFFPASKVRTFNVRFSFGQTQTLFTAGTLTFSAKCVQNGTDPGGLTGKDFSELLVATTKNGGILTNGESSGLHGTGPTDFLNTNTAEAKRGIAYVSANTGTSFGDIENNGAGYGMQVVDPNGVAVIIPDGVTGAVNLFGSNCMLAGFAIIP